MNDFEQMKNNCADDIQLTGKDTTFENIHGLHSSEATMNCN